MIASTRDRQFLVVSAEHRRRRGAMFAYFLVYVLLAGATTAAAGMMLHLMLKSRTADEQRANGIRQLLRIDRQLRNDWRQASDSIVTSEQFTLQTPSQDSIVYSIEADRVQRSLRDSDGNLQGTDRFQFPKQTQLQFVQTPAADDGNRTAPAGLILRLVSPVPRQKSNPMEAASAAGHVVEFFLAETPAAQTEAVEQPQPLVEPSTLSEGEKS